MPSSPQQPNKNTNSNSNDDDDDQQQEQQHQQPPSTTTTTPQNLLLQHTLSFHPFYRTEQDGGPSILFFTHDYKTVVEIQPFFYYHAYNPRNGGTTGTEYSPVTSTAQTDPAMFNRIFDVYLMSVQPERGQAEYDTVDSHALPPWMQQQRQKQLQQQQQQQTHKNLFEHLYQFEATISPRIALFRRAVGGEAVAPVAVSIDLSAPGTVYLDQSCSPTGSRYCFKISVHSNEHGELKYWITRGTQGVAVGDDQVEGSSHVHNDGADGGDSDSDSDNDRKSSGQLSSDLAQEEEEETNDVVQQQQQQHYPPTYVVVAPFDDCIDPHEETERRFVNPGHYSLYNNSRDITAYEQFPNDGPPLPRTELPYLNLDDNDGNRDQDASAAQSSQENSPAPIIFEVSQLPPGMYTQQQPYHQSAAAQASPSPSSNEQPQSTVLPAGNVSNTNGDHSYTWRYMPNFVEDADEEKGEEEDK